MRFVTRLKGGLAWAVVAAACPLWTASAQSPSQSSSQPGPATPGAGSPGPSSFSVQTLLTETVEYDTNPLMQPTGAKALYGSVTSPQVVLTSDTPSEHAALTLLMNANEFNLANYGSEDGHATLNLAASSAHWSGTLGGTFDYDTTRTSEQTSSGVEVAGVRHAAGAVMPSLTYNATQVDQMTLAGSFSETRYANTQIYTNYLQGVLTPTYTRVLDQTNLISLSGVARHFETRTGPEVQFNDFGGNAGWKSLLSETWSLNGDIGAIRRISDYSAVPPFQPRTGAAVWELTFDANAAYKGLQDTFSLGASRAPTPLSVRSEADLTRVTLSEAHQLTQTLELDLAGSYQFSSYSGTQKSGAYIQKNYVTANPQVQYHLTDTVSFSLSYNYRRQQSETLGSITQVYNPATGNSVMFVVSFAPYRKDW